MKALIAIAILGALAWFVFVKQGTPLPQAISDVVGIDDARTGYVEVVDQNGRNLECRLTGKHGGYVRILRKADGQEFVIALSTLSTKSQNHFAKYEDFNQASLKPDLLKLATREIQPELLYIRDICSFRCPSNGRMMQTKFGVELDAFRSYLSDQGIRYREVNLQAQKASHNSYYLPQGIKTIPCIRVGETIIYQRNGEQIEDAIVEHFIARNGSET